MNLLVFTLNLIACLFFVLQSLVGVPIDTFSICVFGLNLFFAVHSASKLLEKN